MDEIHRVRLKQLPLGEPIYYRVITHKNVRKIQVEDASEVYCFQLPKADAKEVRFAQFADTHERLKTVDKLMARIAELKPDFFIWNGDVMDHTWNKDHIIKHILLPIDRPFASTIPMVFSRGNHDAVGAGSIDVSRYIGTPDDRLYYEFRMGPAAFLVLDTEREDSQVDRLDPRMQFDAYRADQSTWITEVMSDPKIGSAPVKIAIFHIPFWSKLYYAGALARKLWAPPLEQNKVNLCMCGHIHTYEFFKPGDVTTHQTYDPDPTPVSLHQVCSGGPALMIVATVTSKKITLETENLERKVVYTEVIDC